MTNKYVLVGREVVHEPDLLKWATAFEDFAKRRVASTLINSDVEVSTAFIGLDHGWGPGPPEVFETKVFGGVHNHKCVRCSTWLEAEVQHVEMCNFLYSNQGE